MYAAQAMMLLGMVVHLAKTQVKFAIGAYVMFYGCFALWCLTSTLWSAQQERAFNGAIGIVHFVILGTALIAYITAERNPEFILNCLAWSTLGLIVVLITQTPPDVWHETLQPIDDASSDENRLGSAVGYHPNALGRVLLIGTFIWIYKLKASRAHFTLKALAIAAMVATLLLTKSRLSIALFIALVFFFLLFNSPSLGKFILRTITGTIALSLTLWAILNIPVLYDAFGFRFAAMLGVEGERDASTSTRFEMTGIAIDMFAQNPLLGVGFDNYSHYYYHEYHGWAETYAHNTYAELLAGLGLIGIVTYYAIPIFVTFRLYRHFRQAGHQNRTQATFLFLLAATQLVADVASISYTNDFVQLTTALLLGWVLVIESDSRNGRSVQQTAGRAQGAPSSQTTPDHLSPTTRNA